MSQKYGVTFPILGKVDVKGSEQCEVYKWLQKHTNEEVEWNFGKFIVDRHGQFVKYVKADVEPELIKDDINNLLQNWRGK